MICSFAMDDIECLESIGLYPTPQDIIRLNALGLKLQATKNKNAATSLDFLPRVAQLTDSVYFRQPTVGHEIWLERVSSLCDDSFQTLVAVRAYALSRNAADLVDPCRADAVKTAVSAYADELSNLTRDQIVAALDYVIYGASQLVGESASMNSSSDGERIPDGTEGEDWKECIALGVLNEAKVVLFGMNQRDMENMTRRQLEEAIARAYFFHHMDVRDGSEIATARYYSALDEIRERLKSEKRNG